MTIDYPEAERIPTASAHSQHSKLKENAKASSSTKYNGTPRPQQHFKELKKLAKSAYRHRLASQANSSTNRFHSFTSFFGTPSATPSPSTDSPTTSPSGSSSPGATATTATTATTTESGLNTHAPVNTKSTGTPDAWITNSKGILEPIRSKPRPYLAYMFNAYKNLFLTFYFNWTMLISAPVSSMSFLVFFPTAVMFLFIFEVGLKVFMDYLGGVSLVRYISMKYGHGFGAINWGTPGLLLCEDVATLVRATLPSLGVPTKEKTGQRNKTFDLSIAQTLIVLSSVIYERDTDLVKDAYELYVQSMDSGKVNFDDDMESECERDMKQLMWDSESRIRSISASWGLHFAGVSELKSLGGPFCGIFWSEEHPFIVIAFKGTTPTNYEEFLVDGTFQRTDARSYLFGSVHEGFYESVFPSAGFGNEDTRDPYGAILAAIHEKSAQLQESLRTDVPVQVWITGHSLGAAMSSLLFARWLKCPKDLTKRCVLRDAYVIGTPAVGDNDFASNFSSYTNNPVSRSSTLWRMINKSDIICRLPPGYDNSTIGHYMKTTDFFNYSHVGHAIQINRPWSSKPFHVYPSGYQVTMQIEIVLGAWGGRSFPKENYRQHTKISHNYRHNPFKNEKELVLPRLAVFLSDQAWLQFFVNTFTDGNPIHILESVYPFFFQDHLPVNYFDGLGRIRDFCHDTEQRQRRTKD